MEIREKASIGAIEVTTGKVCPVTCTHCPQLKFREAYGDSQFHLKLDDFITALKTVPTSVCITFAGFSDPFVNKHALDMMEHVRKKGHRLKVFSTLEGLLPKDVPRFAALKPDILSIHEPDNTHSAHIKINDTYKETFFAVLQSMDVHLRSRMDGTFISNQRAGNCDGAPPLYVRGPFHCGKLVHPEPVMLPDCSLVLCCFHPDTKVFAKLKIRRYRNPLVGVFTFKYLYTLQSLGSVEGLWSSFEGKWQPSRIVRSANPGFIRVVMDNGAVFYPTTNHQFDVKETGTAESPVTSKTAVQLKAGDLLPFDLAGIEDAPGVGDFDLGRFVGLYLAEGAVFDTFHLGDNEREMEIAHFLSEFGATRFGATSYWTHPKTRPESHSTYLRFGGLSHGVRGVLSDFVEGSTFKTKKIRSQGFTTTRLFREGLVKGIWDGDGCECSNGKVGVLTLDNPYLAEQVTQMMASIGVPYTFNPRQYVSKAGNDIAVVYRSKSPNGDLERMRGKYTFSVWGNGRAWSRIRSVESGGNMRCPAAYCFEVTDGKPYFTLANGFMVHNCMDWKLEHPLGSLLTQSWDDIIQSEAYRSVVRNSWSMDGNSLCRSCTYAVPTLSTKRVKNAAHSVLQKIGAVESYEFKVTGNPDD